VPELFFPAERVSAIDLGPPGKAGPDIVAPHLLGIVEWQIMEEERPRPDQAHVAPKYVEQLGQLVEAGGAQPAAEFRQTL